MELAFLTCNSVSCGGGLATINCSVQFKGVTMFEGNMAHYGGGMYASGCNLVFQDSVDGHNNTVMGGRAHFTGNHASYHGGGIFLERCALYCDGTMGFERNTAQQYGGGAAAGYSSISFYGAVNFTSNTAFHGGGMCVQRSDILYDWNVILDRNTAENLGGGICAYLSSYLMFNGHTVFSGNSALTGAGVYVQSSDMVCTKNVSFTGNAAEYIGGGFTAYQGSSISFKDGTSFTQNSAVQGGGMNIESSELRCTGSVLLDSNYAVNFGGGIVANFGSLLLFNGSAALKNNVGFGGGGIFLENSNMVSDGMTVFDGNVAERLGGGLYALHDSSALFSGNVSFANNTAFQGGGMNIISSVVRCAGNVVLDGNRAEILGGGIDTYLGSFLRLHGSIVLKNNSGFTGAGINIDSSDVVLDGTTVFNCNKAADEGGGLNAEFDSSVSFYGSTVFMHNSALKGGGMFLRSSDATSNGTMEFDSNIAVYYEGGGIHAHYSSTMFNGSVVLKNNSGQNGGGINLEYSDLLFEGSTAFECNKATNEGGGIHAYYSSTMFNGSVVLKNNSGLSGGGIKLEYSDLISKGTTAFECNKAADEGGGINVDSFSSVLLHVTATFKNNSAVRGGGMFLRSSDITSNGTIVLEYNMAEEVGGGLTAYYSFISFHGKAVVTNNHAYHGGGLSILESSQLFCNGTADFTNNAATEGVGGGLVGLSSFLAFHGYTTLTANSAFSDAGMYISSTIQVCDGDILLDSNRADLRGGGIGAYSDSSITFCGSATILNNSALQGGGMNVEGSDVICSGDVTVDRNRAEEHGGGIILLSNSYISLKGKAIFKRNTAATGAGLLVDHSIVNCDGSSTVFDNNSAIAGAGMLVNVSTVSCIGSNHFYNNKAAFLGGGIYGADSSLEFHGNVTLTSNFAFQGGGMTLFTCSITCDGVALFDSNTAEYFGGGLIIIPSTYPCTFCSKATFLGSAEFTNNQAVFGGGVLSLDGNVTFAGNAGFYNNSATLSVDQSAYGGGFFGYRSFVSFLKETTFGGNTALEGGGMYGSYTTVIIDGSMNVAVNSAIASGGGFYFTSETECKLMENSYVSLALNYAGEFGGGVYIRDDPFFYCINIVLPNIDYPGEPNCAFQPTMWPTTATVQILDNNYAEEAGSALYGGLLDRCRLDVWNDDVYHQEYSDWLFETTFNDTARSSFVSSDPIRTCPCVSNKPDCNTTELASVFPGGTLNIAVVAIGQRSGTVPSVITATFLGTEIATESQQNVQFANKTCTLLEYTILPKLGFDPSVNSSIILHSESPCQSYGVPLLVTVHLLPCPSGFELSQTPYTSCICSMRVQQYTNTCDIDTQTILRHGQYWIGWDTSSSGAILHPHCPFDYCRSGNTSFHMNDTDRQCQHNRAGVLCGGCEHGYSLGFGSSRCLQCSTNSYLSLILAFILAGIILVIFLLTFKLTVAVGTINGLIFYANIVAANPALYFPKHNLEGAFLRIFIAWINLDLGIETCFYRGMDIYTWTWLQFVFPLYIWTLVGIVIVFSHYFSWATKLFGSNPVAVLATLFLLSYTKILRTIITAMSFTYLDYPDNPSVPVWLYDGNVRYLEGKHIALFIAVLLALLLLFLPYTLVIFCGQWIEARSQLKLFRWISDYRVKAFLDAYHGPLKSKHRYWPGLLLVTRTALLLVFAFNALGNPNINLLATTTSVLGLITFLSYAGAVYTKVYLHLLELSFLVNCVVLAAAHGIMSSALSEGSQLALTYTSVSIAFATFIGILVYHTLTQARDSRVWKDTIRPRLCSPPAHTCGHGVSVELDSPVVCSPVANVTTTSVDLRELALEDERIN